MNNSYLPFVEKIQKITIETEDRMLKTLEISLPLEHREKFDFLPGQFCQLSVLGKGEAPFGIASSPGEMFLKFTINKIGMVTTAIHQLSPGDEISLRGPLGNAYPVKEFTGKDLVIIGGGFAFTTLRSLVLSLLENRNQFGNITIIYGARTPGMFLYQKELAEWKKRNDLDLHLTIDQSQEGWKELVGFVPDIVGTLSPPSKNAYAVICGPPLMLKLTFPKLLRIGFSAERIFTSLEMKMKCGIGMCGRCNIGRFYVCKDGPIFSLSQLRSMPQEY